MRKSKIILGAAALASTAAIVIAGTAGAAVEAKNERFTFITTSTTDNPTYSVVADGAFVDGGTAKKTKTGLALTFPDGTITLDIKKGHKKIVPIMSANACLQTTTKTGGSFTIAGGTGAYRGITGSGHNRSSATAVEQLVHGNCSSNFSAVQFIATASGTVSLP